LRREVVLLLALNEARGVAVVLTVGDFMPFFVELLIFAFVCLASGYIGYRYASGRMIFVLIGTIIVSALLLAGRTLVAYN
jgi:hypothetical protein